MIEMLTPSLEDYLEEIYRLSLSTENIRVTDISNKLNVSLPSVSKALMRLKDKEYIKYEPYGNIRLTLKGNNFGKYLVERNRILQEFLSLICSKCDITVEAEAMEHYLSKATIDAIQGLVKFFKDNPNLYQQYRTYIDSRSTEIENGGFIE